MGRLHGAASRTNDADGALVTSGFVDIPPARCGAHVGTVCAEDFPTTFRSWWGRDRPQDRLPLPWLVQELTAEPARFLGLHDRGRLAPGLRADLNVLDFAR